ncbi:MAG: ParM/StbA family protein [Crocosphaera sp.]
MVSTPKKPTTTRRKGKSKVDLAIAIDFGGSLTKIIGGLPDGKWCAVTMEPEVVQISEHTAQAFERNTLGNGRANDRAWIKINEQVHAVGYLAKEFLGDPGLWRPKVDLAVYKILAAIWVLKEHWQLKNKFSVSIACVLPPGEYEERDLLEQQVKEVIHDFETPTGTMKIRCPSFVCRPEGFGVLGCHQLSKGMSYLKQTVTAVVMLGHRNSSLIVCDRGRVSANNLVSSDLGFIQLVRKVMDNVAGQDETKLGKAIAQAGVNVEPFPLEKVLRHTDSKLKKLELEKLVKAIRSARSDYMVLISNWLAKTLTTGVEEIVLCGGTADYLGEQGWQWNQSYQIYWHSNLKLPSTLEGMGLGNRMLDVWGLWKWHQERIFDKKKVA